MIDQVFGNLWGLVFVAFDVAMILLVLARKREAAAALGWGLAIVLLPVAGSILFLLFGMNRLPRRLRRKVAHRASFADRLDGPARPDAPPEAEGPWGPVERMLVGLGESPPRPGNDVLLLAQGIPAFERMGEAIRAARHHVHVEFYIFRYDRFGRAVLDLLAAKAQEGVEVRLCVDHVGTLARWRLLRRLRKAGGQGAVYLPLFPFGKRVRSQSTQPPQVGRLRR